MDGGNCVSDFVMGTRFCFMKSRKKCLKIHKKFPVFSNKIKTRAYIRNLRHGSLHSNVFDISAKFQRQGYCSKDRQQSIRSVLASSQYIVDG